MPKKSLGQNFLKSENILSNIVKSGNISKKDIIIEIGPGTGNLTEKILEKAPERFIVIEKDRKLSELLHKKFRGKIEIINEDILKCFNNFVFKKKVKVFGNLPYNISTKILISFLKISNLKDKFEKFIFVFQKEVADRILAKENSKNYGRLSILTSLKMNSSKIIDIDPKYFYPKPKVWSSLVSLSPRLDFEEIKSNYHLDHITNIFFSQRRKMIKKPMKKLFIKFEKVAKDLDLDLNLRPQNLSKNQYLEICKIYDVLN